MEHPRTEAEFDAWLHESQWRKLTISATPGVLTWMNHFLNGGTLSASSTLDERAGWLLAAQAPRALRQGPPPEPALDDLDDAADAGD